MLDTAWAPLLHLPVQACLPSSGIPPDCPREGQPMWDLVSITAMDGSQESQGNMLHPMKLQFECRAQHADRRSAAQADMDTAR